MSPRGDKSRGYVPLDSIPATNIRSQPPLQETSADTPGTGNIYNREQVHALLMRFLFHGNKIAKGLHRNWPYCKPVDVYGTIPA